MEEVLDEWLLKEDQDLVSVSHHGLIAHSEHKWLTGSPDGVGITKNGRKILIDVRKQPLAEAINDSKF